MAHQSNQPRVVGRSLGLSRRAVGTADSGAAQGGHWPPLVARRRTRSFPRAEAWARSQAHSKLRSPSSLASATGLAPPRVVGTVPCRRLRTSGLGSCKGPAHRGDSGPAREQRPAFPSSKAVSGKMGPGSQRVLVLLLLLLASPGARAFQVSVPAARLGVPLSKEVALRPGQAKLHSCAGVGTWSRNSGWGLVDGERSGGPPSVIAGDLSCCSLAGEGGSAWESPARESYFQDF